MDEGTIRGVNLAQAWRSLTDTTGAIRDGSFRLAISPEAETDFTSLRFATDIRNGRGDINPLELTNPFFAMSGTGTIDFGNRSLQLKPKLTNPGGEDVRITFSGQSVSLSAIPLLIGGDWTAISGGLDTSAIETEIRGALARRAEDAIGDRLGDVLGEDVSAGLGAIIGSQIGGGRRTEETPETGDADPEDQPPSREEQAVDLFRGILGDN